MRCHARHRGRVVWGRAEALESRLVLSAAPAVSAVSFASSGWNTDFTDHLLASGMGQNHLLADDHEVLSAGYLVPTGSSAQEEALPWDNVDQIRITFTKDVLVNAADLALTSTSKAFYAFADFQYYPEVRTAVWTLVESLTTDRYQIDLDADGANPVTDLGGTVLDGEWTDSISTGDSGDGVAGGDFEFAFNVLPGDLLGLGVLEWNGFFTIYYREGLDTTSPHYLPKADLDADGLIEAADWQAVYDRLFESLPAGTPIGTTNDAPSTTGFAPVEIDAAAGDVVFSLNGTFDDAETADAQLTFAIESVGDSALFDTVSIDSATGELTVNVAAGIGRTEIVISATDASGQKVFTPIQVDANRQNTPPSITVSPTNYGLGIWVITGQVTDPDPGTDYDTFFIDLTGFFDQRVSVADDGSFYFSVLLDPGEYGSMWAEVSDGIEVSNSFYFEIG